MNDILFEPVQLGDLQLGYCRTPGIYDAAQAAAWRRITDAVHDEGGLIVAQLMHVGRVASALNKPVDSATVAPSAITARGEIYTDQQGMQPLDAPRALSLTEIAAVVADYRRATELAYEAGFDGVELHCTSGYLPAQFFSSGSNTRQDEYGGSAANRCRFALDVLREICSVDGAGRVGMRICPDNPFNDLQDDDPQETFDILLSRAAELGLAYLHTICMPSERVDNLALGRKHFGANMIGNESYSAAEAATAIGAGAMDAVSFGRDFIANPDLPRRIREGRNSARMDFATLYTPGEEGYISYSHLN